MITIHNAGTECGFIFHFYLFVWNTIFTSIQKTRLTQLKSKYLIVSLCFLFFGPTNLFSQGYIDCATILAEGDIPSFLRGNSHTIVKDDVLYIAFRLRHAAVEQRLPVINGVDYNSAPANIEKDDVYFAMFDDNCNQIFGTYFGGTDHDLIGHMALDAAGNIVITGRTSSTDFPTTDGTSSTNTNYKPYVRKYAPDGTLVFSTVIVGTDNIETPDGIITDGTDIYVYGTSESTVFPTTNGTTPPLDVGSGNSNGFMLKYDGSGNLLYSTVYGGTGSDQFLDATVANGKLYLIGATDSADFPTTDGSSLPTDAYFYMRLDGSGNLEYSTMYEGISQSLASQKLYSDGSHIYIGGNISNQNFPTTDGSMLTGGRNAFIRKYDLSDNLIYSKIFGSNLPSSTDIVQFLEVANGDLYIGASASGGYPVTTGVANAGGLDLLLVKLDAAGNEIYSTYYGGFQPSDMWSWFSVNTAGEVYGLMGIAFDIPNTDGTLGRGATFLKFNVDGSLCNASSILPIGNTSLTYDLVDNTFWFTNTQRIGFSFSTDGTQIETQESSVDIGITKFVLCPDPTPITSDLLTPSSQMACQNGLLDQIIGEKQVIDGTSLPPIYMDGVLGSQADIALEYQWQFSANNTGPWTDIATPLGRLKNYSPPPTTVDIYYRRVTKTIECCGGTILSTSNVSSVLISADVAPTVDAGGVYYTCPGNPVTIGGSPAAMGGTPAYTYSWNDGEFTIENPAPAPSESGIYTLQVTDANGCIQADQATLVVYSADAGEDKSVCDGEGTIIGGSALSGVSIIAAGDTPPANEFSITYDWTPKDGSLSCTDCPNPLASGSVEMDYTLAVTINYPDGTSCQTTDMVNVTVVDAPTDALTIADTVVCLGQEVELGMNQSPLATFSLASVTQSSEGTTGTTATITNLTDGDFTTGGHTNDGSSQNITVDLGSLQTISKIQLAALVGQTGDDRLRVEVSNDNSVFIQVAVYFTGLNDTELTNILFEPQEVRYIRLRSSSRFTDVSISEVYVGYDYTYIWTPGTYLITDESNATFDAGNLDMPSINPITYTLSATLEECTFYEEVTVAVIEARAGDDGCGPRFVGEPDRTPNIDETYTWTKITDAGITTGTGDLIGVTNEAIVSVSASVGGNVGYELMTTYTLNGSTSIWRDTVIVPPVCGSSCDIVSVDEGCPSFDAGSPGLAGIPPDDSGNWTYSWTSNEGMVGLDNYTNEIVYLTDNVTRTYYVTFTSTIDSTFSCTDSIDANSAAFSTPIFNVNSPIAVCSNTPFNIGNPANNLGLSYEWSNAGSLDDPTISYPEATITTSTDFTVTVTDMVTGCLVVDTVRTTIEGEAVPGEDFTVCDNATITLGNNNPVAGYTYAWEPAGADWRNGTDQNDAMPDAFVATTQEFNLTVTTPAGCVSRDTILITVEPLPPTFTLPDLDFCPSQGTDLVLGTDDGTATGTNLIPNGYFYSWNPTNVSDFSIQNPTVDVPLPTSSVTYELEVRAAGGCNQRITQTINPTVSAPIVSSDNATICLGESVSIGNDANPTGGGITYSWNPTTNLDDATVANPIFTPTTAGTSTYTVTKTEAGCSVTSEVTITTVDIIAPILTPQVICAGSTVMIGPSFSNSTLSYQWNPTTDLDNPFIANPTFSGTSSTNYTLTIFDAYSCTAETSTSVTVNPAPTFLISLSDTTICDASTESLVINAGVDPSTGSYAYVWSPSDYLSNSNVLNPTFFIPTAGTYEYVLEVIDQMTGCSVFDTMVINNLLACDWGDLSDSSSGTAVNDYQTTATNNGPVHVIIPGLSLGSTVDTEIDGQPSNNALGDGVDEDGITIFSSLALSPGLTFKLPFSYLNTTGETAHVEAWIDWNGDGDFNDPNEMVTDWNDGTGVFPNIIEIMIPQNAQTGIHLGLRIRISNQDNMTPYGQIDEGEVEDYLIGIDCPTQICVPIQATIIQQE